MVRALELELGIKMSLPALFQTNSVAGMAAHLHASTSADPTAPAATKTPSESARLVLQDLRRAKSEVWDGAVIEAGFLEDCPDPWSRPRCVLLTGATGFLGRYMEWV